MEDTVRAVRWFLEPANTKETAQIAERVSKRPAASFEPWLFKQKDYYRDPNMMPDLDALQANFKLQTEMGFLKTELDARKYANLSIIQEAAKRLK